MTPAPVARAYTTPSDPAVRPGVRVIKRSWDDYGLTVEVRHEPDHVLVTVAGEVDIATVSQLQEPLASLAASGRPLIVDLLRVTFIDASGLGVLASVASRVRARGGSLHAVCVRHLVRRLFTITGLDRQIPLACTVTEARHSLTTVRDTPVNGHGQHAHARAQLG